MMQPEFIGLLLFSWITLVILQAFVHFFIIEVMDDKPHYMQWFLIRGMMAIFHGAMFQLLSIGEYMPILLFQLTSHFVIFNPLLNRLREIANFNSGLFYFWYVGTNSGWFDKFFLKNQALYKVVYFMSCVLIILAGIVIYQKFL